MWKKERDPPGIPAGRLDCSAFARTMPRYRLRDCGSCTRALPRQRRSQRRARSSWHHQRSCQRRCWVARRCNRSQPCSSLRRQSRRHWCSRCSLHRMLRYRVRTDPRCHYSKLSTSHWRRRWCLPRNSRCLHTSSARRSIGSRGRPGIGNQSSPMCRYQPCLEGHPGSGDNTPGCYLHMVDRCPLCIRCLPVRRLVAYAQRQPRPPPLMWRRQKASGACAGRYQMQACESTNRTSVRP